MFIGTVQVRDTDPSAPINLQPSSAAGEFGGQPIKLVPQPILRSVNGLRVRVMGTQDHDRRWPDRVTVLSFEVIGWKFEPAIDGVLAEDGGTLYVVETDGRRRQVMHAQSDLRAHVGARVWIAGPLDRLPVAYGVIE